MIINARKGNIQVLGDVKEFKTSIDPKNLEFITTLLSSNLYSDPEQSFIREIVSNAWDSHVEAGTTDIPVIIKFNKISYNNWEISIRDFGTGLSLERFKEVYCNIGSSTKRESNDYIGGFGIGKYSSLACSNTVYITSYYNGIAYMYVMVKSENTITTNLVTEKPTKEKNGVEVTIKNISKIEPYKAALSYIVFFPNVYVDGIVNSINNTKLKRFNNFAVSSTEVNSKILLGNVLYPCNELLLSPESRDFLSKIKYSGIAITFNVGDLTITPNRESIIYSSSTIAKIDDKIRMAKAELDALVKKCLTKDYNNLYEYWKALKPEICYNPLTNTYTPIKSYYIGNGYYTKVDTSSITFKGSTDLGEYKDIIGLFFSLELFNLRGVFNDKKFYQNKFPYSIRDKTLMSYESILSVNSSRLTSVIKHWLLKNYKDYAIVAPFSKEQFITYLSKHLQIGIDRIAKKDMVFGYMYDFVMSKIKTIDLDNDKSFLDFKEASKTIKVQTNYKDIIIYIQRNRDYREKLYFNDMQSCIKYLESLKSGIILSGMKDSCSWYSIACSRGFKYITARKEIVDYLNEIKPTFLVNKDWVLSEDPFIIKIHTILEVFGHIPLKRDVWEVLNIVPLQLRVEFIKILDLCNKFPLSNTYLAIAAKCKKIDPYTKYICEKFKECTTAYTNLSKEVGLSTDDGDLKDLLMTAIVIKERAFRVNLGAYNEVKNNKLLKVLCRK